MTSGYFSEFYSSIRISAYKDYSWLAEPSCYLVLLASIHFRKSIPLLRTEMTLLKRTSPETPLRHMHRAAILSPFITCDGLVDEMLSLKLILWGWHHICGFVDCLVDEMVGFSADFELMESHLRARKKSLWQRRIRMWCAMWHRPKEI